MSEFYALSAYLPLALCIGFYLLGMVLRRRFRGGLINPLLVAILLCIAFLQISGMPYATFAEGTEPLSLLLTPATVCLALPLYRQWHFLRQYPGAILCAVTAGALTSMCTVLLLCRLLALDHTVYVTLLPKSITTAIGMGVAEELGGMVTITVAVIVVTGILGNLMGDLFCKVFRLTHPVAKGLALGSSAHAIGTAKAMELGEVEGAISSLAIVLSGLITVAGASVFAQFA